MIGELCVLNILIRSRGVIKMSLSAFWFPVNHAFLTTMFHFIDHFSVVLGCFLTSEYTTPFFACCGLFQAYHAGKMMQGESVGPTMAVIFIPIIPVDRPPCADLFSSGLRPEANLPLFPAVRVIFLLLVAAYAPLCRLWWTPVSAPPLQV